MRVYDGQKGVTIEGLWRLFGQGEVRDALCYCLTGTRDKGLGKFSPIGGPRERSLLLGGGIWHSTKRDASRAMNAFDEDVDNVEWLSNASILDCLSVGRIWTQSGHGARGLWAPWPGPS